MPRIVPKTSKYPELSKQTPKKDIRKDIRKDTINNPVSQRQKRTQPEIRNLILDSLARYPKSTHAVSKDIKCRYETALFNLEFLRDNNKVEVGYTKERKYKTKKGKTIIQNLKYWRIKQ